MAKLLLQSVLMLLMSTLITGIAYPLVVTAIAALVAPDRSTGSLLYSGDRLIGSRLIGQPFDQPRYFWPRPSATTPQPYNGGASSGSNLGPTNPAQLAAVQTQIARLQQADPDNRLAIPVDLVTASASGLDPQISPAAAAYQLARVARARGMAMAQLRTLVAAHTEARQWGLLGEPRVNVLELNLALDRVSSAR